MSHDFPQRVSELLCSRLCHDLISPTAAVSNGLELLEDESGGIDEGVMSLLSFSIKQAAARLMFFRIAYGLGGENADALSLKETSDLVDGIIEDDKINANLPSSDEPLGRIGVKVYLNLAFLALETLPNRGNLAIEIQKSDAIIITAIASGAGTGLRPEVAEALKPEIEIDSLTARSVQGYFTAWLCKSAGGKLIVTETPDSVSLNVELPL
ncbi:MAG: hypothetical protein GKS01_06415 [Alphaproteobacteria bacterium]|nr:hypothetical protein [Alphaproteobacteria bacterium]